MTPTACSRARRRYAPRYRRHGEARAGRQMRDKVPAVPSKTLNSSPGFLSLGPRGPRGTDFRSADQSIGTGEPTDRQTGDSRFAAKPRWKFNQTGRLARNLIMARGRATSTGTPREHLEACFFQFSFIFNQSTSGGGHTRAPARASAQGRPASSELLAKSPNRPLGVFRTPRLAHTS